MAGPPLLTNVTPDRNVLAELLQAVANKQIPMEAANKFLQLFQDNREPAHDVLPESLSLNDIGSAVTEGYSAENVVNGIYDAIGGREYGTGRELGLIERAMKLFPVGPLKGGKASSGAITLGAGRVTKAPAGVGRKTKAGTSRAAPKSKAGTATPADVVGAEPGLIGDIADPSLSRGVGAVNGGGPPSNFSQPVTHNGKDLSQWTPEDFADYGKQHGVDNLGPLSPPHQITDLDGNSFEIPGGFDDKFTYYDLLHLKSQGINADRLDPQLHTDLAAKLGRTMSPDPGGQSSPEQIFNGILFGMTSPNQPLLPNQMAASRLRVGSEADIARLAGMIPWKVGDDVPKEVRQQFDRQMAEAFSVQGGERGGLGIKGSADYTRIAELAQLFQANPEWFRIKPNEAWPDYVDRLSSQVTGLGTKTGSFSSVWQNPAGAQVSAMDRHMAARFFDRIFPAGSPERAAIEGELVDKWNANVDRRQKADRLKSKGRISKKDYALVDRNVAVTADATRVTSLQEILAQSAGDGFFTDNMLQKMGAGTRKLNTREGTGPNSFMTRNPGISEALQNTDWIHEPEMVKTASPLYKQALEVNAQAAQSQGLSLFMSQWRGWDRQRRRLEPHENMFPGLEKLPRPSDDQLRATLKAHRKTGHLDYTKEEQLNAKGEMEARLRPTRPTKNPASMAFFSQANPIGPGTNTPGPDVDPEQRAIRGAVAAYLNMTSPPP